MLAAGSLTPQGPVARDIADLWWLMLVLGTAVYLVFGYFLGFGLFRRRGADPPGGASEGRRRHLSRLWIVGGGVAMPILLLAVVFGATIETMRDTPTRAPDDALVVEIVGHQWWWEVHYPDTDVRLRNELHIPVGRPVELRLTSADVIHSFWVPALAGKMDLLPDHTTTLVLQADEPGEHTSLCAEFCGLHHADMVLNVVVEPPERFASWAARQARGKGP